MVFPLDRIIHSLCLVALLAIPTSAIATTTPKCTCVPGSTQTAPGPGGCELVRACKEGVTTGTCSRRTFETTDEEGIRTIHIYDGKWTRWIEYCPDTRSEQAAFEHLLELIE